MTDAAPSQTPGREPTLPGTRAWFVFFVAWMIAWAGVALWGSHRMSLGDDLALRVWLFALTCFYLSLCNTFLPLPTAWAVLLVAAPGYALVQTAWLRVLFIAGTLGAVTAVANLNEYYLLAYLLRFGLGQRIRRSSIYGWAVRWFDRSPFQLLLLIAFVPVPVDVVRWLAVLRRYPRVRFAWAYFAGRSLRYLLFAGCSTLLALGPRAIVLIQAGLVVAALLSRLVWWLVRRRLCGTAARGCPPLHSQPRAAGPHDETTLAAAEIGRE